MARTQCIHRGSFFSVDDLKAAIQEFLASWNEDPKPLVWTATVESIMEKLSRPANAREDSARLYPATKQKEEAITCILI